MPTRWNAIYNKLDLTGTPAGEIPVTKIIDGSGTTVLANGDNEITLANGQNIAIVGTPAIHSVSIALTGQVHVANGGTGAATLTDHGILLGSGTNAVTVTNALANGELLIGVSGSDPVPAQLVEGAGIQITNAAGSITVASTGGGFSWVRVAGVAQDLAVSTGYTPTNVALTTFTLPATAAVGDVIKIDGESAAGWTIAQRAGQQIHVGVLSSTAGVGGSVASSNRRDCVTLRCLVANTEFIVESFVGNLAVT